MPLDGIYFFQKKITFCIAIDNGISQYDTTEEPRYRDNTDLSSRVGKLNANWNETVTDTDVHILNLHHLFWL